jgi:acetyltransferase
MHGVTIRPIRRGDAAGLSAFYAGLSPDSRHARFLGSCSGLSDDCAARMCSADGQREAGFVATAAVDGDPQVVGHVGLMETTPGTFEVAVAVADAWQGAGIGRKLFRAAVGWAELNGVGLVVATAFSDNWRVLRLLASTPHPTTVHDVGCGVSSVTISIGENGQLKRAARCSGGAPAPDDRGDVPDDQHRALGVEQDRVGHAAQQCPLYAGAAMRSDDDQVRSTIAGDAHKLERRYAARQDDLR